MKVKKYQFTFSAMTTACECQLFTESLEKAQSIALKIKHNTLRLEKKYNFFNLQSLLSTQINNRQFSSVDIDAETLKVLTQVKVLEQLTDHYFDITVGTIKHCDQFEKLHEIDQCRADLRQYMGPDSWWLTDGKLYFANDFCKLDLGGVIKEIAVDQAISLCKAQRLKSALINFGGDLYALGRKPDGQKFTVAIKNPKNPQQMFAIIDLENQAMTTSAHYERSRQVEKKQVSHLICSQENNHAAHIISASVISESVLTSGILSTALMFSKPLTLNDKITFILIDNDLRVSQG